MKRMNWKIVAAVVTAVLVLAVAAFVIWSNDVLAADDTALAALTSDAQVNVKDVNGWIEFSPVGVDVQVGFVFYPGGKVDHRAYAPLLKQIAAQGYFVAVMPVKLNLAFFDINAADPIIAAHPEIQTWFVGGHSLGGVAASIYASEHENISGVVFWASYPADDALKVKQIPAVSIFGTNDGLATSDKLDASRELLLADTQFIAIEGGNHAQFGSYGPQAGDNPASIFPAEQWSQAADATIAFFIAAAGQ